MSRTMSKIETVTQPHPLPLPPAELASVGRMIVHYDRDNNRNASTELGSVERPIPSQ